MVYPPEPTSEPSPRARAREERRGKLEALKAQKPGPLFLVTAYQVVGQPELQADTLAPILTKYTGANVGMEDIGQAAFTVQAAYRKAGHSDVSVAVAPRQITNGIVTLHIFQAATPQVVVAGKRFVPPVSTGTNPPATFPVRAYEVTGDTLLQEDNLREILGPYTGTNVGVAEILKAGSDLQLEYRDRGYPTVNVTIPPQQITNGIVQIRVFEGQLTEIVITNNHYFSAENIMRALPSLHVNDLLVGPIVQSELDRANANQDRQIYSEIAAGPQENTSALILDVHDRLPLHVKAEVNNQYSPGTPDLRVNVSAAYNNFWQREHSAGVQYSFSPLDFKDGNHWAFHDQPLVANYSAFYRFPLGEPEALSNLIEAGPGSFGYDEATRRFRLPAPSGRPELNFYASRSAIDTGLLTTGGTNLLNEAFHQLDRRDVQQDLTVNNAIGARLTLPVRQMGKWQQVFSFGPDFKNYDTTSYKTNEFVDTQIFKAGDLYVTNVSVIPSKVDPTRKTIDYLPLSLRYDANRRDAWGSTSFGLGLSFNVWHTGSEQDLQRITGSKKSSGNWLTITPSLSRDFIIHTNWILTVRADGQIATEPLMSNEQFGAGGVNSVRGYYEGEVFGDNGWHISAEQKTPALVLGIVSGRQALTVRGSVFMDYAETYLLDPQGRNARIPLWGIGVGAVASIGTYWEARFIFSVPLQDTTLIEAGQPRFNFALTAQF